MTSTSSLETKNMRSALQAIFVAWALTAAARAHADGPLVWEWVTLNVATCQAVKFESPPDDRNYVPGETYKTAVLTGTVVASGFRPYDTSNRDMQRWVELRTKTFPKVGASLQVAMREWNAGTCSVVKGKVQKFNYADGCDTLPRRGQCLVPLRLVEIASERPEPPFSRASAVRVNVP